MIYAYARVSARDQNLDRQLNAFHDFGVQPQNIYCDKKSGKDFIRTQYLRLLKKLKKNDLLVIKSIDRLGRNYRMILDEWNHIVNRIGANILVLDMPLLDTRAGSDSLVGKFISDIVLQVLSFVAENERDNIRARQAEGIASARSRGVRFGRPPLTYSPEMLELFRCYQRRELPFKEILARANMKSSNFYYHYHKAAKEGLLSSSPGFPDPKNLKQA